MLRPWSPTTPTRAWERHALLAGLAASVIVVMLTVAVVNEVLERRSRQRWSILAQYMMLELVRNARMIWSGILEAASLLPGRTQPAGMAGCRNRHCPRHATADGVTPGDCRRHGGP